MRQLRTMARYACGKSPSPIWSPCGVDTTPDAPDRYRPIVDALTTGGDPYMLMADYGLVLYGNAVMVNPDFAAANPEVVAKFVRATIKGVQDTVKDPESAIDSVMKRNETADRAIELARLKMALKDNIATPWVLANGFGGVDPARLAASIDQIAVTYDFTARPKAETVFSSEFLPPAAKRMLGK